MTTTHSAWSATGAKLQGIWIAFAAIAVFFLLFAGSGHAAPPLAGTSIGNQASATYVDGSNVTRSVSSNVVSTIVQQVAALTITQSLSKTAAAGTQVSYPVTLTNTGNGTDSFGLVPTNSGGFTFPVGAVIFYADANGDGVADNTTPITSTGSLTPGAVFRFVAIGNVPTTAASSNVNSLVITATSGFAPAVSAFVTDTTTITANAVINVSKTMSAVSGLSGSGPYTVTLSYNNTGNIAATGVTLTDILPAGMTYVGGTGRWSVTGATPLTDAADGAEGTTPNITYSRTGQNVTGVISSVAAGQAGTLKFDVSINPGLAAAPLDNTATFTYNDGVATVGPAYTNTFVFTVNQTASVTSNSTAGTPILVGSAAQGSTVSFDNVFTNTGNGTDSFDVAISGLLATGTTAFPAGSSFALYKADGVTPLVDTNGNGISDTGPVAAGASYTVVLKVTLPAGGTGGPFSVSKTATSKFDPAKVATGTDRLTAITANSVDLTASTNAGTSSSIAGLGAGPFVVTDTVVTNATNPGTTTRFSLNVVNGAGSTGDTFNMAATSTLPAGWTVVFRDSAGTVITNTGIVASGGTAVVFADVTVPAGQAAIPAGLPITFRALSPSTGSADRITDSVIVNTIRSVTVTPTNVGQVTPGGSVIYTHTITNAGNVAENVGSGFTIALSLMETQAGFTSVVYLDANNNNIIDATDPVINAPADLGSIAAGASRQLLVKVSASSGVGIGVLNTTTLTATTAGTINGAPAPVAVSTTDATTVISGNIVLLKEQALDANCDGVPDGGPTAYSVATITTGAIPTACIRYRVTATNNGTANVDSLVVSDATPVSTTYHAPSVGGAPAAATLGVVSAPADGTAGTVKVTFPVGTPLTPSASVVLTFGVKINP